MREYSVKEIMNLLKYYGELEYNYLNDEGEEFEDIFNGVYYSMPLDLESLTNSNIKPIICVGYTEDNQVDKLIPISKIIRINI